MGQVSIRRAKLSDLDWLIESIREFSAFAPMKRKLMGDEVFARQAMARMIEGQVVIVAESEGSLVGFIAGTLVPHPLCHSLIVLSEMFWWVSPDARMSRAGLMLLNEFEKVGRAEADWIIMSLIHGRSLVRPKSLEKRGFRHYETAYVLEV